MNMAPITGICAQYTAQYRKRGQKKHKEIIGASHIMPATNAGFQKII